MNQFFNHKLQAIQFFIFGMMISLTQPPPHPQNPSKTQKRMLGERGEEIKQEPGAKLVTGKMEKCICSITQEAGMEGHEGPYQTHRRTTQMEGALGLREERGRSLKE